MRSIRPTRKQDLLGRRNTRTSRKMEEKGMNRAELVDAMAKEAGLSKADTEKALKAQVKSMEAKIAKIQKTLA